MKEINLREFYPEIYKTDLFISLPDEVVDVLVEYQRKEVAYRRRTYRHKAFFSLDYGDDIEREAVLFTPTLHVEDVLTLGAKVKVVCLGKDKMGRISFSMKDVVEE